MDGEPWRPGKCHILAKCRDHPITTQKGLESFLAGRKPSERARAEMITFHDSRFPGSSPQWPLRESQIFMLSSDKLYRGTSISLEVDLPVELDCPCSQQTLNEAIAHCAESQDVISKIDPLPSDI
jgi:hypothetical protein